MPSRGYPSSDRHASDLGPPPSGPAPGADEWNPWSTLGRIAPLIKSSYTPEDSEVIPGSHIEVASSHAWHGDEAVRLTVDAKYDLACVLLDRHQAAELRDILDEWLHAGTAPPNPYKTKRGRIAYEPPAGCGCRGKPDFAIDGTVWECGDCSATWVAHTHRERGQHTATWRREGRFARWRRERQQRREQARIDKWEHMKAASVPPREPSRPDPSVPERTDAGSPDA